MAQKKVKNTKKRDLPSFLFPKPDVPDSVIFQPKTSKSVHHLGPIFFGCHEYQPMFHSLNLGPSHEIHKTASSTENILRDAFLPKSQIKERSDVKKVIYPAIKAPILFTDPYPHKCPGVRKVFVPESPPVTDFGETKSIIEGEASEEIPVYCIKKMSDDATDTEYEVIALSDMWEKKRIFMSYKERIAHAHFPKQFVTVRVIGPTIPAAITITKLPSKRKTESELRLEVKPKAKAKKGMKVSDVKTEKYTEGRVVEENSLLISKDTFSAEEQLLEVAKSDIETQNGKENETNEGSISHEHQSEHDATEWDEDTNKKEKVEVRDEEGDLQLVENVETGEGVSVEEESED